MVEDGGTRTEPPEDQIGTAIPQIGGQQIHRRAADEARGEDIDRLLVQIQRRSDLKDTTIPHHDDPVGHGHGFDLIVSDEHRRRAEPMMQAFDLDAHLRAQLGIEVRERFVEEERGGVANHRPADGDALALAAREGRGPALQEVSRAERFCCLFDALLASRSSRASGVETEGDVVGHGHMRIDRVVLEHHGDVPVFRLKVIDDAPVDSDLAAADFLKSCNHPQRRRLAAS